MIEPPREDSSTLIFQQQTDSPGILETLAAASENMRCEKKDSDGGGGGINAQTNHAAPAQLLRW
jgi:hypothetical protein